MLDVSLQILAVQDPAEAPLDSKYVKFCEEL